MVHHSAGTQKNRLQVKKISLRGETCPTYCLRPSNGHSSPGTGCPESLCTQVADLAAEGAPRYFMYGTPWRHVPSILHIGLSCRGEDKPRGMSGRQMIHGCPCVPGDQRTQSGQRAD
eukprot:8178284-Pyramimonas_sp.AAC.1